MSPELKELIEAAKQAREALSRYWFTSDSDGEEYNNDDVIDADERLEKALAAVIEVENEAPELEDGD